MNNEGTVCQSCSMPVETGPYCRYCVDENGELQAFDERLARLSQFMRNREPGLTDAESETRAVKHMATMPAWRDHPEVRARLAGSR